MTKLAEEFMVYDCLIIGGGFAGISAGIYMARYNRSALIIDQGNGRWNTHEINENYLGFPDGILAKELRERGLKQALNFGAKLQEDVILDIKKEQDLCIASGQNGIYTGRSIILATGVKDILPEFPNWQDYWGKSLFWCITCDGHKAHGKKIVVVGQDNQAATTAMQFLNFTSDIIFVTNLKPGGVEISSKWKDILKEARIPFYEDTITDAFGKNGMFERMKLEDGTQIPLDFMFSLLGNIPNNELAKELGVDLDKKGFILTDIEQRTNIPLVFAAGDVTRPFSHQVVTAAHEGATAADVLNYELYRPEQKED